MPTTREAVRAFTAANAALLGVEEPAVRFTWRGSTCRASLRGEPIVTVPRRCLRRYSDDGMRGVLAHELAHIKYDSGRQLLSNRATAAVIGLYLLAWAVLSVAIATAAHAAGLPLETIFGFAGTFGGLAAFVVLRYLLLRLTRDESRLAELRADLAAAQALGREPVLAGLQEAPDGPLRRLDAWLTATHPQTRKRIAVVSAYDLESDPDAAARVLGLISGALTTGEGSARPFGSRGFPRPTRRPK